MRQQGSGACVAGPTGILEALEGEPSSNPFQMLKHFAVHLAGGLTCTVEHARSLGLNARQAVDAAY